MAAPFILVVDDQPINVQLLKRKLEREGIRIAAAYNGIEALEAVTPERVVDMNDRNATDADRMQMLDRLFHFGLVLGAHVEDQGIDRLVEDQRAGRGCDQRDAGARGSRQYRFGVRRAAHRKERHRFAFGDQAGGVLAGQLGVEFVIDRDQRDLAAIDAAGGIDRCDVKAGPAGHFGNRAGDRTCEAGRLRHYDLTVCHPLGRNRAKRQGACKRDRRDHKAISKIYVHG